jgi:hypothetical protein
MITAILLIDPQVPAIYISAKRGENAKVEGQKIAEQVVFLPRASAVQVLTRSEETAF